MDGIRSIGQCTQVTIIPWIVEMSTGMTIGDYEVVLDFGLEDIDEAD